MSLEFVPISTRGVGEKYSTITVTSLTFPLSFCHSLPYHSSIGPLINQLVPLLSIVSLPLPQHWQNINVIFSLSLLKVPASVLLLLCVPCLPLTYPLCSVLRFPCRLFLVFVFYVSISSPISCSLSIYISHFPAPTLFLILRSSNV